MAIFDFSGMQKNGLFERQRPFAKMHGLGNDFVVFDGRTDKFRLDPLLVKALGNRRTGIGFDQCILLHNSENADAFMEIWNNDGSQVGACGNATRCVAMGIMQETDSSTCTIETAAGLLACARKDDRILVDMGEVSTKWSEVPLFQAVDTKAVNLEIGKLPPAVCLSVGNPHAVFIVDNVMTVPLEELGPQIEAHWMFPEKVNASFVEVRDDHLRVRVWERGAGMTRACGTAACAALVATNLRGLTGRSATIILDGGKLAISWLENGHVLMTGPVKHVATGIADIALPEDI